MTRSISLPAALLLAGGLCASPQTDSASERVRPPSADWPSWRGPNANGHVRGESPPTTWSETENIKWKVRVPGLGISSPIIWKDRIYLTTAVATKRPGKAIASEPQHRLALPRPTLIHEFAVLALDRADGRVVWRRVVAEAVPHEGGHSTNSHASISPITDGESLFANFGSRGLYCLDFEGKIRWSKDLGRMRTRRQYGEASSPTLWKDRLIVNWDHEGDSFVVVFDKRDGRELWRRPRDEVTSWSTPLVVTVDGRPQIVINATTASRGYDLESGDVIWHLAGMTVNCIPSPIHRNGVVFLMSGYRGRALQAVSLSGAKGDLAGSEHVKWTYNQRVSYVPSALLYEDAYYFLRGNTGVLSCLDATTGKPYYEGQKLGEIRSVYASPVGAGGHVYITSRDGITQVLRHGRDYKPVATNRLDDAVDASLAVAGDEIYLRGRKHMYCIAKLPSEVPSKAATEAKPEVTPTKTRDDRPELFEYAGTLGTAKELTASLSTADLDGDGDLDIVVANGRHWPGQNKIFLNDGKGRFEVEREFGAPSKSYAAALADFDRDGDVDVVVGNDREPSRVYWNDGRAGFTVGPQVGRIASTRHVMTADLDGVDGPDVVFSTRGGANLICFNDGKGGFDRQVTFGSGRDSTIHCAAGDIDGDGDLDLAIANRAGEANYVFVNDGKGGFSDGRIYESDKHATRGVAFADIDRDGNLDILNANIGRPSRIWFGDGGGRFSRMSDHGEPTRAYAITSADINADGRIDVVIANAGMANAVWLQGEDGRFTVERFGPARGVTYGLVAADFSGNGRPEIATANSGALNGLFRFASGR